MAGQLSQFKFSGLTPFNGSQLLYAGGKHGVVIAVSSSVVLRTLGPYHRYAVEQLSRLGPWQIREVVPGSASRIIATCPDQEMADAIAKFLNGDPQGAYSHLRFHKFGEEEDS